jgi:hypothetical protein
MHGTCAELNRCDDRDVARIARDLSLTAGELHMLARRRAQSPLLLYRRMADLGMDRADVARTQPEIMRDLQKLCAMCDSKRRCARDFARGADRSIWHAYCPNDGTLNSLAAPAFPLNIRPRVVGRPAAGGAPKQAHAAAWLSALLLIVWVLLSFNINSQRAAFRFSSDGSTDSIVTDVDTPPEVTCLDASCLSVQQQLALRLVSSVKEQGLIDSGSEQLQALPEALRIARDVREGEALACSKAGGTTHYGLMFRQGCRQDAIKAAELSERGACQAMTGGGVCFVK